MSKIGDRLGDRLEPGGTPNPDPAEEMFSEKEEGGNKSRPVNYPIHYSAGTRGSWTTLNFSDPTGKKSLIPDYTAERVDTYDTAEKWQVGSEEATIEVEIDSELQSKDELANALKTAYEEALR